LLPTPLASLPPNTLASLPGPLATAACTAVVLVTPFAFGLPTLWLLRGRRALTADDWLLAPFVGLGALVLALQNLVYLDVPVARSAPWLALAALSGLAAWAFSGRARDSLRAVPRALLALALAAYLAQGLALLQVGPRHWVGRLWEDQFSYTGMAQFFLDERFDLDVDAVGQRPWLFRVLRPSLGRFYLPFGLKENRIGQSVLHAFHAALTGGDAKALFGPTILLGAPLLVLGVALVARRLGLRPVAIAGAAWLAALAPAFTLLQLESFLSHALVLAFFPVWLVALDDLGRSPRFAPGAVAALVLSFAVATYGELWLALLALAAVMLGLAAWRDRAPFPCLLAFGLLVVAPFVLNPRFMPMLLLTTVIGATGAMHTAIYPFAYSPEGAARLWLGDLALHGSDTLRAAAGITGVGATLLGLVGLTRLAWSRGETDTRALRVGLLCLALGPLPFLLSGRHPYQFYKLMQTALPALCVGVAALLTSAPAARARRAGGVLLGLLACGATCASLGMVARTAGSSPEPRSNAGLFVAPEARALHERLETLRAEDLIVGRGLYPLQNAWVCWFARFNRVWLSEPFLGRDRLERSPDGASLLDLRAAPAGALWLTRRDDRSFARPPARVAWANAAWELWRPTPGPWVTLFDVDGPGTKTPRLDLARAPLDQAFALEAGPLRLRLLSGAAGRARVRLQLAPRAATGRVFAPGCTPSELTLAGAGASVDLACPVRAGVDDITLRARADARAPHAPLDVSITGVTFEPR
jgi:hypothetical protein